MVVACTCLLFALLFFFFSLPGSWGIVPLFPPKRFAISTVVLFLLPITETWTSNKFIFFLNFSEWSYPTTKKMNKTMKPSQFVTFCQYNMQMLSPATLRLPKKQVYNNSIHDPGSVITKGVLIWWKKNPIILFFSLQDQNQSKSWQNQTHGRTWSKGLPIQQKTIVRHGKAQLKEIQWTHTKW